MSAWVKETMVLVREVPMLAPMTMGTACWTEMTPLETMETMMEVQVEELWTSTVNSTPTISPTIGLERRGLL